MPRCAVGRVGIQLVCWARCRRKADDEDQHGVVAEPAKLVDLNDPQTYQDLATPMPETRQQNANLYFFRSKN